ncbi:MAG: hypothetical protein K2H32_10125 [Muribaculaceae bacterium]|nr:hypothetical protein [Muribaculaceae bacterium]
MNIIFLDFDGVMDTAVYDMYLVRNKLPECDEKGRPLFDPACIENLKHIIELTESDVVITSDWKYIDKYEDLLLMWRERDMPGFMTDTTPNVSKRRGDEIQKWLDQCQVPCNYVIIDDLNPDNFNDNQLEKLVTVNPYRGLDSGAAEQAIAILNKQIESEKI